MIKARVGIAAAISILLLAPAVQAQTKSTVGTLTCVGGEGVGLIVGSSKSYSCKFTDTNGRVRESYNATVTKVGLDVGVTGKTVIVWSVLAASSALKRRALTGDYGGAAADASIGVGGGAKVLVGGSNNSIVLQPVSVQGQTGINLAVGVAGLNLR